VESVNEIGNLLPDLVRSGVSPQLERLRLLESVVVNASDAVLITKAEPVDFPGPEIIYCNAAFTKMTGYSEAEIIGRTPRLLHCGRTDRTALDKIRVALSRWEAIEVELLNRRKDGTDFWVQLSIVPVPDEHGRFTHWVSVQRDITERKAAEATATRALLAEAENLLLAAEVERTKAIKQELIEAHRLARLGTWRLAADRTTMVWSDDTYAMFGLGSADCPATIHNMLAAIQPGDRDPVLRALLSVFDRREAQQIEFGITIGEHDIRHCRIEARPVVGVDGALQGLFGFCQDITQHKAAEVALLRAERLRTLGQLTGGVAHDFNNLLTVTMLNLEGAIEDLLPDHPVQDLLRPALHAAARGAELTSRLLAYARRAPLRPEKIEIRTLFDELSKLLGRSLGEQYQLDLRPGMFTDEVFADPGQLENAIMNLAINARDAMPDGGTIAIIARCCDISEQTPGVDTDIQPGRYAVIEVCDHGTGIPPELLPRVSEPFFTTKPPESGSGLGLSMVYGFARQSGGHLHIMSTPGGGTTVSIYLPAKTVAIVQVDRGSRPQSGTRWSANGLRVLAVEDQAPVLQAVTRMLRQLGFEVTAVQNATAALAEFDADPSYDLLFTDIVLPAPMSGTELANRARQIVPRIRVVLTSGYSEDGLSVATDARCDGFMAKPYGREQLRLTLSRIFPDRLSAVQ
jgi:PAS domain S-box-containing protein